ncbi:MAG: PDZ domain-containing protein [Chloracidobacterium sp.]
MSSLVGALLGSVIGYAQVGERSRDESPSFRKAEPPVVGRWMVIVTHHVTMGELTATVEDASTAAVLDGTCAPTDVILTNVTTGIVVDDEGHVLTQLVNLPPDHANPTIMVQTQDHQELRAKFIGRDGATGMCVLQVPGLTLPSPPMHSLIPAKKKALARDSRLSVKPSIRIMMPLFQRMSERPVRGRPDSGALQIVWDEIAADSVDDAPLALPVEANCGVAVDQQNRLVAIVQPKGKRLQVWPIEDAKRVTRRIIAAGRSVPHGWLGIEGKTLTTFPAQERANLKVRATHGVVVTAVVPGSPAEEAGLIPGDVILKADGHPLESRRELNEAVVSHAAGEVLNLLVERDGQPQVYNVTLGSPEEVPTLKSPLPEHLALGIVSVDLTAQLAAFFGVTEGLLVTHVFPESPASASGLRSGDVIIALDGKAVRRGEDLATGLLRVVSQGAGAAVTLEIIRERKVQQLPLSPLDPLPKL